MKHILVLYLPFLVTLSGLAQSNDEDITNQLWLDYKLKYYTAGNLGVSADLGARAVKPKDWVRYFLKPELTFTHSPLTEAGRKITSTWHFGAGFYYTDNLDTTDRLELRPFQGYNLQWPNFKRLRFRHYFRLEERFEHSTGADTWQFNFRGRYQFSAILNWEHHVLGFLSGLFIPFHTEFFFDFDQNSQFSDLMRISPGVGYHINADWRIEFYTSYHRVRNAEGGGFETNDIVFRFRLFQDII